MEKWQEWLTFALEKWKYYAEKKDRPLYNRLLRINPQRFAHYEEIFNLIPPKRGELDFIIELDGRVIPIEVKSGKDYEVHRALSNLMDCEEYDLPEALILTNDNLSVKGRLIYAPIYMSMFLDRNNEAPTHYKVDLSGLI